MLIKYWLRIIQQTLNNNGNITLYEGKDYLNGIELKNNLPESIYNENGRAFNTTGTSSQVYRYEYYLKDHLDNIRIAFTDKNNVGLMKTIF